eukprot:197223-Pyramimonas_sp.AAC.1
MMPKHTVKSRSVPRQLLNLSLSLSFSLSLCVSRARPRSFWRVTARPQSEPHRIESNKMPKATGPDGEVHNPGPNRI